MSCKIKLNNISELKSKICDFLQRYNIYLDKGFDWQKIIRGEMVTVLDNGISFSIQFNPNSLFIKITSSSLASNNTILAITRRI